MFAILATQTKASNRPDGSNRAGLPASRGLDRDERMANLKVLFGNTSRSEPAGQINAPALGRNGNKKASGGSEEELQILPELHISHWRRLLLATGLYRRHDAIRRLPRVRLGHCKLAIMAQTSATLTQ